MKDIISKLNNWLEELSQFKLPDWDELPDLYLYMDQVVTYLERELKEFKTDDETIITPWMINNYVKGGLIPIPDKKKYSKEHLGYMIAICMIKHILSINDIKQLLDFKKQMNDDPKTLYDFIRNSQISIIKEITKDTDKYLDPIIENKDYSEDTTQLLYDYATKLALEASMKKIISNRILNLIAKSDLMKKQEIEAKEKEKLELEKLEKERTLKVQNIKNPKLNK